MHVLTANRLTTGDVVYWGLDGWVFELAAATLLAEPEAEARLGDARDDAGRQTIVNPYLFDVRVQGGVPQPVKTREAIRARGPSVRPDTGKQAG